jgi:hypothetical protein
MIVCAALLAIAYTGIKQSLADALGLAPTASAIILVALIVLQVIGAIRLLRRLPL